MSEPFHSIYKIDEYGNKQLVCGAVSKQSAEETLHKHPGYENADVEWKHQLIFGQTFHSPIREGIIIE